MYKLNLGLGVLKLPPASYVFSSTSCMPQYIKGTLPVSTSFSSGLQLKELIKMNKPEYLYFLGLFGCLTQLMLPQQ